jgi:O-antigen ligase
VAYSRFQQYAESLALICTLALGISLPFSTALDNVLLYLGLLCWLASGHFGQRWQQLRQHPLALVSLGFMLLLALGLTYGERADGDGALYFRKYLSVLFIPVFITLFHDARWRQRARLTLATSLAALLVLSYLIWLGVIPHSAWIEGTPANPIVTKGWITHSILIAFGVFLFSLLGLYEQRRRWKVFWFLLAVLGVGNVIFMMQGRTGYLALAAAVLYLGFVWWRIRGLALGAVALAIVIALALAAPSALHQRTELAVQEFEQAQPGTASQTSVGLRLEFYRNTLALIRERPLLGFGTGGFRLAYEKQVAGSSMIPAHNPHNQYLLLMAELGIPGLLILLTLWWTAWHYATRLPTALETHLARGLVLLFSIGCLFNSLLLDHTEGLLFAWSAGILFAGLQSFSSSSPPAHG